MTSSSLAKRMTSTYATWRWCCNAFSMPDSGRTLRRRDSSMPRPNTAAMQSALTDCTSCPPRWTQSATLHSRPMSANIEVFLVWWTIMLDSCRICRQRCTRSTDCCSTTPLGTGLMPALLLSTKWNVISDLIWCWRISTRIYRFMWQVMPRPMAWALFFLTPCLTEQSGPSPLLLARWTPQSRITARLTRKPLVLCGALESFTHYLYGRRFTLITDNRPLTATMIHSGTLCIQRKVTKFPCYGGLVFRAQFQDFLSAFWRSFFAMQLALVSMITITPTLSLSVFSLQRTRLFPTCGELWRTCGELWLYFEMQRRLDLWSFSWSSRRSREAHKWAQLAFKRDRSIDYRTDSRR